MWILLWTNIAGYYPAPSKNTISEFMRLEIAAFSPGLLLLVGQERLVIGPSQIWQKLKIFDVAWSMNNVPHV